MVARHRNTCSRVHRQFNSKWIESNPSNLQKYTQCISVKEQYRLPQQQLQCMRPGSNQAAVKHPQHRSALRWQRPTEGRARGCNPGSVFEARAHTSVFCIYNADYITSSRGPPRPQGTTRQTKLRSVAPTQLLKTDASTDRKEPAQRAEAKFHAPSIPPAYKI